MKCEMVEIGQRVYYVDAAGSQRRAIVKHIHYDQDPPYYTIQLVRHHREIQTEANRLRVRQRHKSTAPSPERSSE